MPQISALEAYWREVPPADVLLAAHYGYSPPSREEEAPAPLPAPAPTQGPFLPEAVRTGKPRITKDQVNELFRMFPSGKITMN